MDLELTPEQNELRALAADLLARRVPPEAARAYLEGGGDARPLWNELAELGWYAVGLDEDDPFGVAGICVLAEQLGRVLAPSVLVDAVVAARIAAAGGENVRAAWLERLQDAPAPVSLAVAEPAAQWSREALETTAVAEGSGRLRVSGTKIAVHHGSAVDAFGVLAVLDDAPAFLFVERDAAGVEVVPEHGLDPTAGSVRVVLDDVAVAADAAVVGVDAIEGAFAVGAVATAAEAVGAASAALDLAVAYAKEREQFGRRIGSFQAVQQILADAHVLRETAWSAALYAAAALDEHVDDAAEATTIAQAYTSRVARTIVQNALQVLGGIGFTWEHDLHLFLRRVLTCEQRFGDALFHERQLAAALAARADERVTATTGRSRP
jgi:alkylation response protein AidB-like acyl-CoA dehydrogenase